MESPNYSQRIRELEEQIEKITDNWLTITILSPHQEDFEMIVHKEGASYKVSVKQLAEPSFINSDIE